MPGAAYLASLRPEDREALAWDEALFLLVATSVGASAWVALVLAEAGVFSVLRAAGLVAVGGGAALAGAWRKWGRVRILPRRPHPLALLPLLAVLASALAFQARPTEYLVGGRDPGTYVAAMALIGRTGGVAYVDPAVRSIPEEDVALFYRNPGAPDYTWGRFMGMPLERPETGRVVPEFFHLFPAFGAYLFQAMGVRGALATPCVFGVLGTLGVFFAWRRVFGAPVALLATLLLAVNVIQVWFGRYPMAEGMSQFLLFLGLLAFALWEERGTGALGALAGAALGLSLLVRIDGALVAVPLGVHLLARRARGEMPWARLRSFALPFLALFGHTLLHAAFWSRKYVLEILHRPYWAQPFWVWVAAAVLVAGAFAVVHRFEGVAVAWAARHGRLLRRVVAAAVGVLALYAYFVRPRLSAWAGGDGNTTPPLDDRGWLLALGFHRLAAHDAQPLVRLGWFLTPLVLLLAGAGLLLVLRRWERRFAFPLLLAATYGGFFLYKIRVHNDYYFALRRFMPVVVPALLALAALALLALWGRGRAGRMAAGALAVTVTLLFLRDTAPLFRYRDWAGAVRFVDDVARRFGPRDVVIFEQPRSVHLLSLPLWAVHGVHALQLARFDPDPERLQHLVDRWADRYRHIYFVHTYNTDLCGLFLQRVEDLRFDTYEWERAYVDRPRGPEPRALHFRISRVLPPRDLQVPPLRELDVGGSDDVQVSGFFDKEGGGERTYRWTGRCASVFLPGVRAGDTVTLTAATGRRPAPEPVPVRLSLAGTPVGTVEVGREWTESSVVLPAALPEGPPVLRLDAPTFRPVNVLSGTDDARDLGVMIDRIRLEAGPGRAGGTIPVSPTRGGPRSP